MTRDEYEAQERRLTDDIDAARETLNRARAHFDRLCEELRALRQEWRDGTPVHAIPGPDDNGISRCCGRRPFDFRGEHLTRDPDKVTCRTPRP